MRASLKTWIIAFRVRTLTAAFVPILSSMALAHYRLYPLNWTYVYLMLTAAFCIQIATNLFNDALDFRKGADKERVGPLRVTQSGLVSERAVFIMASVFCVIAFLCGIPLVIQGGWPIVSIGLASLFLTYGYTSGPFPLAYKGFGDLFVVLFFGLFAVNGSYYILTGRLLTMDGIVLGLQVGFLATVLIALNNLRDSETDAKVNKKTLAVRFGDNFVKAEITLLLIASYAMMFYWSSQYYQKAFLLFFLTLPITFFIFKTIFSKKDSKHLIKALGMAALLQMCFGAIFTGVCLIAS